ncbi:MAG: hypothetical protein ACTHJ0_04930 [Flavipsychrobacter sp.]
MMKRYIGIVLLMMCSMSAANAQVELSNAIEFGYPVLLNKSNSNMFYSQVTGGLRFGISFKPQQTQFFPTLNFSFGRTRLPMAQFEQNVAVINMNYLSLMLHGNFVIPFENGNTLYVLGGIGFTKLKERGLAISGHDALAMSIHLDSVQNANKVFPALGLGFEYVYGSGVNSKVYLSFGFMMQYIYLFAGRNSYYASVVDDQGRDVPVHGDMTGHVFAPTINITLHWLTGNSIIFWRKRDGRYL